MIPKRKLPIVKKLIIAKKLLQNSEELIELNSLEKNLVAISNLNSAFNIILMIFCKQAKIKSIKQLDNISLEKQWNILSKEYKKRFDQDLSMKTQIFTLNNIMSDFIDHGIYPTTNQVLDLTRALSIFIEDFVDKVFELEYKDLDLYLLIENNQVQHTIKQARKSLDAGEFEEVLKAASSAFQVALEDQRRKINYLSERNLINPELIMLDKSISLNIKPKEEDFIHLILKTPQKDLQKFKQLVPTAIIAEDKARRSEVVVSDYVSEVSISNENAEFCLNFVLETILNWENMDLMIKE